MLRKTLTLTIFSAIFDGWRQLLKLSQPIHNVKIVVGPPLGGPWGENVDALHDIY